VAVIYKTPIVFFQLFSCQLQIANYFSQFPDTASFGRAVRPEVILVFKDEGHDEINDDGRSEREERQINKVHADMCGADSKFLAPPGADPISLTLKPKTYPIDHLSVFTVKLQIFQ
jgi:hypothetical protein